MPTSIPLETLSPVDEEDFSILVQPKLVFANERTFLAYMHVVVLLSGVALGMLNFGSKQALVSAFMFTVLSIIAMIYALKTFHSRARSILSGVEACFSDRLGPSLLLFAFLITVAINFTLRFAEL
ncbi:vacuolar transporter chaperone 1 [Moniliophthora roreri MCA 2997]|uniref:Vacuolar transporter chaperone 1 n=1 Tax=Moniliophthora roreri (strain MCA 2997) TaxID=1381753 RepID=V2XTS5_MONRO|nr:vacuolar transporter chaperone 1 [Moniliophthora roreri MCA 2997]